MRLPFDGTYPVTQTFEEHNQRRIENGWQYYNGGIDYGMPSGTPIYTVLDGTVSTVEMGNAGYGNVIKIDHGNGLQTLYAHFMSICALVGDHVQQGQMIGRSDNTGNSTGPHLHFEVRQDGVAVDPQPLLDGETIAEPDHIVDVNKKIIGQDQTWNMRASPWGEKLALVYGGAEIEIIETSGEWCKIKVTGYMHKTAFEI